MNKETEWYKNQWKSLKPVYDKVFDDRELLIKKVERYEEALKEIADPNSFDDMKDEVITKRFIAKQALENK